MLVYLCHGVYCIHEKSPCEVCLCVQVIWTAGWAPVRGIMEVLWCVRMNSVFLTCGASSAGGRDVASRDFLEFIHKYSNYHQNT